MQRGVSLLELMLVIAILAIMASMAMPSLSGWFYSNSIKDQAGTIAGVLEHARLKALKEGVRWRVLFYPGKGEYLAFGDADGDGNIGVEEEEMGPFFLDDRVRFGSSISSGPNSTHIPSDGISLVNNMVSFSGMGSCNAGTVYLSSGTHSYALRILPATGTLRIWEYRGSWEAWR